MFDWAAKTEEPTGRRSDTKTQEKLLDLDQLTAEANPSQSRVMKQMGKCQNSAARDASAYSSPKEDREL